VTSQLQLRALSLLGLSLVAIWSLSPIGGQASLRIMTIGLKDTQIPETFSYMVTNGYLGAYSSAEMMMQGQASAGVVFIAALMGSPATKASPLDLWGNVKIPRIENYGGVAPTNEEGWYDTQNGDVDAYSSLIGIPINGINSNFINHVTRVQSPYLSLQCSLNTSVPYDLQPSNKTLPGKVSSASSAGNIIDWDVEDSLNATRRNQILAESITPLRIKYIPRYRSNMTLDCNITSTYVETEIRCPTTSTCSATRVRRTKLNHFPSPWTLLDVSWRTLPLFMQGMLQNFNGKLGYPQLSHKYLPDPNLTSSNYANVSQTTEDKYTIRLGHMLNSYFACLNGYSAITTGISNDTAYFYDVNQTFTLEEHGSGGTNLWDELFYSIESDGTNAAFKTRAWSSDGTKVERKDVVVAHRGWVITLCLTSIVLIVASLVAPVIHHFLTVGIDLAMNISSLATRNNSHMTLPSTGTYLDASDRARLLRNHKVRFGDVDRGTEVGSLAIGSIEGREKENGVARVEKRRLYE
jgi:hypothetical protein